MAQSRETARTTRASAPAPSDLGAWDKLQLGWLDYETVLPARRTGTLAARPARVQHRQGRRPRSSCLPKKQVDHDAGRPVRRARKSWWSGTGDDHDATMTRNVTLPAGTSHADLPGEVQHRGLRPGPVRLRLRRGQRRHRLEAHPGQHHQAGREQRHRRHARPPGRRRRSTCRPTPARRSGCGCATRPTAACRATTGTPAGPLRRRHQGHRRGDDAVHRRVPRPRPRAGRWRASPPSAPRSPRRTTTTTSPRTATYMSFDKYLQSGPYNFGFATPSPTSSSTSPTRTACWSATGTPPRATTTPASTRAQGLILPVDAQPGADRPARRRPVAAAGGRATTRRSVWRSRTRSRCTSNGKARTTSGARRPSRCSTTTRPTGTASSHASVKVPNNGVNIKVTEPAAAPRWTSGSRSATDPEVRMTTDGAEGQGPSSIVQTVAGRFSSRPRSRPDAGPRVRSVARRRRAVRCGRTTPGLPVEVRVLAARVGDVRHQRPR